MVKYFPFQLPLKSNTVSITAETFFESLRVYHTSGSMEKNLDFLITLINFHSFIHSTSISHVAAVW